MADDYSGELTSNHSIQRRPNNTGIPDQLKSGIEVLSGIDMNDVHVHYNSSRPAQLQAMAYAQGNQIHLGPGQERHLPHEAWHVVQQKQGRVKPTGQLKGSTSINDDPVLEKEADVMGAKAMQMKSVNGVIPKKQLLPSGDKSPAQFRMGVEYETQIEARLPGTAPPWTMAGWVAQDQVMYNGGTWKVVSDNSRLEFVVDPPAANATALDPIMRTMMNNLTMMTHSLRAGDTKFHNFFPVAGSTANYELRQLNQTVITGSMQGTIGVPFEKLYQFFDLLTTYRLEANKELIKHHDAEVSKKVVQHNVMPAGPAKVALAANLPALQADMAAEKAAGAAAISPARIATYNTIKGHVDNLCADIMDRVNGTTLAYRPREQQSLDKLKGLLHFVGQYEVFALNYNNGYKKKSFPVMSRSSFRSMYMALGSNFYKREFRRLVVPLTGRLGVNLGDQMFKNAAVAVGADGQFTVGEWLDSIEQGVLRTFPDGSTMKADRMSGPDTATNDTDKSMGNMGLDNGKVVVELRSIKHLARLATHNPYMGVRFVQDLSRLDL